MSDLWAKLVADAANAPAEPEPEPEEDQSFNASIYGFGRADASAGSMAAPRNDYDDYLDERPAAGLGLGASVPTMEAEDNPIAKAAAFARAKMNFVFTSFQKGGVLDPNADKTITGREEEEAKAAASKPVKLPPPPKYKPRVMPGFTTIRDDKSSKRKFKSKDPNAIASMLGRIKRRKVERPAPTSAQSEPLPLAAQIEAIINESMAQAVKPLYLASENGNIEAVTHLLSLEDSDVDTMNPDDLSSPLHGAASGGHYNIAKLLIERNADLNSETDVGAMPLHIACQMGNTSIVELLLQSGCSVDSPTTDGITALMFAARFGHLQCCKLLVDNGADIFTTLDDFTAMDWALEENHAQVAEYLNLQVRLRNMSIHAEETGTTTLMVASEAAHVDVVEELLKNNAEVDEQVGGKTPLFIACENGLGQVVQVLLEHRADANFDFDGTTAIVAAIQISGLEAVRALVRAGVDLHEKCQGKKPLAWAQDVFEADKATYDEFNAALANASPEDQQAVQPAQPAAATGNDDGTPAATGGATLQDSMPAPPRPSTVQFLKLYLHKELVGHPSELFEKAENAILASHESQAPALCAAAETGDTQLVACLLQHTDAAVDEADTDGTVALSVAACYGHEAVVTQLIQANATVDAAKLDGATPLHMAAQKGHVVVAKALLDSGANPDALFQGEITPLMMAARYGWLAAVKVLCAYGSDLFAATFDGMRAQHLAMEAQEEQVSAFLTRAEMEYFCENGPEEQARQRLELQAVDVKGVNDDGATLLHIAGCAGRLSTVELLLQHKADVNTLKPDGASALHITSQMGHTDVTTLLLDSRADPNQATFHGGITPLMMAARFGRMQTVETLIAARARPEVEFEGQQAIHLAHEQGHSDVVQFLNKLQAI
mmetsp:Transcript_15040/g.29564  ORF Transcript_15040/g.29564 Transcript_15040/m.29564 type:complete len:891 (-) Transcript_15040:113-2785(-)|eukprot:CAMPEP_0175120878 /NCGR_PEP_ID=MMETSP0087-20121206/862_1 /TAXON_ID=136419 /ORGANISM="Unknown Unknown, Strain D1" /LENGTH=890 /DNA_ID=CAMNT_0016402367 /DNA_START=39 /DNA_END=2711 /DNA_ORIENTATION=-